MRKWKATEFYTENTEKTCQIDQFTKKCKTFSFYKNFLFF